MGILFKQVRLLGTRPPLASFSSLSQGGGLHAQLASSAQHPQPAGLGHGARLHIYPLLGGPSFRAVPFGRQDLHVQPVQDALHRPRPADQQGAGPALAPLGAAPAHASRQLASAAQPAACPAPAGRALRPPALAPTCLPALQAFQGRHGRAYLFSDV